MLPLQQRLSDLEDLLKLEYEKLKEHQEELSIAASPNNRNEAKQRIKRDIRPRIREYEAEYWYLLKLSADESDITELEAQTAIATIIQDAEIIQTQPMPDEILQKLREILNKLNEPGTAAAAKAKFVVSLIPGIFAYELELDTENVLRQMFHRLKKLFADATKK